MERRNWTREELILAFNLYCKIPFGKYNQRNTSVIELASLINRTPSSVAFKLVNFASLDPYHQERGVKGMKNVGKLDKEIYSEFSENWNDLIYESEKLLDSKKGENEIEKNIDRVIKIENKTGEDAIRTVKTRVNQSFFRNVITSIYATKCAVSNIDIPELLVASHIIPWSENKTTRLNPSNGICLSSLYDKAFDKGFMTITQDYKIKFSKRISDINDLHAKQCLFEPFEGKQINFPDKFIPSQDFLEFHRKNIFTP